MVQHHEKCPPGVEKNEVEKKKGFFVEKSHATVRDICETGAARPYTSTLRAASARPGRLCEALVTPYDHSTSCLGGTGAGKVFVMVAIKT